MRTMSWVGFYVQQKVHILSTAIMTGVFGILESTKYLECNPDVGIKEVNYMQRGMQINYA